MAVRRQRVEPATPLGAAIRAVRYARNEAVDLFAKRCGLAAHTQLTMWETGRVVPSLLQLLRIGALATGSEREAIVEECRRMVLNTEWVEETRDVMREVAR